MQHITYKYKLQPTAKQHTLMLKHAGVQRFIYNSMLDANIQQYKENNMFIFYYDMYHKTKELKDEFPWIKEVNSQTVQASCKRLEASIKRSF